jgi:predicted DsbA family dithiol-disulfide isomerase
MDAPSSSNQLGIDVISDVVCPWCYIGKHNLYTALQRFSQQQPQVKVSVRWLPFFLDPDTPQEGEPYRSYLEKKFGGKAQLEAIWESVTVAGQHAGINFAFDRIERRVNTMNAHRLIHYAQQRGNADDLVERIFKAHFLHGRDIGNIEVMATISAECGDDPAAVLDYLNSTEEQDDVIAQVRQAQQSGISGVPFFIFNRKLAVSGAQPPEEFLDTIKQVFA